MWLKNHINNENINEYKKKFVFRENGKKWEYHHKSEEKSDRTECGSDTKHILYIITDILIFKTYQLFLCSFIDGHYYIY